MKQISLILFLISAPLYAQRPMVPYCSGNMWGFADTSGNIVVKPFSRYVLTPLSQSGLSYVSAGEDKAGVADTNANFILPLEYYSCFLKGAGILAFKRIKEGQFYNTMAFVFNNKGRQIPVPGAIDVVFPHDTGLLFVYTRDSAFACKVNWQEARLKKILGFGRGYKISEYPEARHTTTISPYTYIQVWGERQGGYYHKDGTALTQSERAEISEKARQYIDSVSAAMQHSPPEITRTGKKYRLKRSSFSKRYNSIEPVEYNQYYSTYSNRLLVREGTLWGIIDSFGNSIVKPRFDKLNPVYRRGIYTGRFIAEKSGRQGMCDSSGTFIIPLQYDAVIPENRNKASDFIILEQGGLMGMCDKDGRQLLEPVYDMIHMPYRHALNSQYPHAIRLTKRHEKTLIYNTDEQHFIGTGYDSVICITEKKFLVKDHNLWGVINDEGRTEIDFRIEDLTVIVGRYDGVPIAAAGNDVCVAGTIAGKEYLFTNISGYRQIPLELLYDRWKWEKIPGHCSEKESINIIQTSSHIIVSENLKQQYSIESKTRIAGRDYYLLKDRKLIKGYMREDGKLFFEP